MAKKRLVDDLVPGNRVKMLISQQGLTQKKFADEVEVSERTISNIVCHAIPLSRTIAELIVQKYPTINVEWLLNLSDYQYKDGFLKAIAYSMVSIDSSVDELIKQTMIGERWKIDNHDPNSDYICKSPKGLSVVISNIEFSHLKFDISEYAHFKAKSLFESKELQENLRIIEEYNKQLGIDKENQ